MYLSCYIFILNENASPFLGKDLIAFPTCHGHNLRQVLVSLGFLAVDLS